jgi:hypothetical protein
MRSVKWQINRNVGINCFETPRVKTIVSGTCYLLNRPPSGPDLNNVWRKQLMSGGTPTPFIGGGGGSIRAAGHNFLGTCKLARAANSDMLTSVFAALCEVKKWSEGNGSEVKGMEVKWKEWKWSELKWSEVNGSEVNWSEWKWSEANGSEVKWREMVRGSLGQWRGSIFWSGCISV